MSPTSRPLPVFKKIAGTILRQLRASRKAPGETRIYTAGEKEHLTWLERKQKGVPVNHETQKEILAMRDELGLRQYRFPFETGKKP
jgi:L-2-hydroxycarboxylate dehydrogenase (NAD+)